MCEIIDTFQFFFVKFQFVHWLFVVVVVVVGGGGGGYTSHATHVHAVHIHTMRTFTLIYGLMQRNIGNHNLSMFGTPLFSFVSVHPI